MGALTFTCPATGREFPSHIHVDRATLARVAQAPVKLKCPICGEVHQMTAKNGHLDDDASPPGAA